VIYIIYIPYIMRERGGGKEGERENDCLGHKVGKWKGPEEEVLDDWLPVPGARRKGRAVNINRELAP
jgi:hypothetical protein